jgi:hypothetical protein
VDNSEIGNVSGAAQQAWTIALTTYKYIYGSEWK